MSRWRAPKGPRVLVISALAALAACATPPPARVPETGRSAAAESRGRLSCSGLVDHFVGLPSSDEAGLGAATGASVDEAPLAGNWWIRRCWLAPAGEGQLRLHMEGPGWYWVDSDEGDISLHQQVPFELRVEVVGRVQAALSSGVGSLWLEPTRDVDVTVKASTDLDLHGGTLWGSFLRRVPFLPVRRMTAERLSSGAASAFRARLRDGVTVTYDVVKGQTDMALGRLPRGETPRHAFDDSAAWLSNVRLILHPFATHVFGPVEPLPLELDVVIERGPGLAYRAICADDMAANLRDVAAGKPESISADALLTSGTVTASGARALELHVDRCPYYLVVSSAGATATLTALRLRAGAVHPRDRDS